VLVVIGILIALQINNWNEDRKNQQAEKIVLNTIYENLAFDSMQFNYYEAQYKQIDNLHRELYKVGIKNERGMNLLPRNQELYRILQPSKNPSYLEINCSINIF
jgi:hypothetical protein